MKLGFFVAGTDTGVGKSLVASALMVSLRSHGHTVIGMKPVASGCPEFDGELRNPDAEFLRAQASVDAEYSLVNPYAFAEPIAPHIAAGNSGTDIDIQTVVNAYERLRVMADYVVVEGVGGWAVPLDEEYTMSDLAARLGLPVILVVGMRLGCLSHAILSAEAVETDGMKLAGWVANTVDAEMPYLRENIATLQSRLPTPLLGVLPRLPRADAASAAEYLDLRACRVTGRAPVQP